MNEYDDDDNDVVEVIEGPLSSSSSTDASDRKSGMTTTTSSTVGDKDWEREWRRRQAANEGPTTPFSFLDICENEFHGVPMCETAKLLGK